MKIEFTNKEQIYLESDKEFKLHCKSDTPEEMKKKLEKRIAVFNEWVDQLNGEKK